MATQGDVTTIQDEDVLRRMWQETEDFSRKKEIRAHMYKMREQRLKEFYSTGEVAHDIQSSMMTSKNTSSTHHADSLLDQSFQSLKSKEIRDSESPGKETSYRKGGMTTVQTTKNDKGWDIKESNTVSEDGKMQSVSRVATKQGSQEIAGGVSDFAARNEATAKVFQDGDEKNYKKAAEATNSSVLKQEAHGVDGNAQFHSTSTCTKSSSHFVSEQRRESEVPQIQSSQTIKKTTTGYVPEEVLKDPNTKVYTDVKTLPDGTKITTTRYETSGHQKQVSSRRDSTTSVQSSSSHVRAQNHEETIAQKQQQYLRDTVSQEKSDNRKVETKKTGHVTEDVTEKRGEIVSNVQTHQECHKHDESVERRKQEEHHERRTQTEQREHKREEHHDQQVRKERITQDAQIKLVPKAIMPEKVETRTTEIVTETINDSIKQPVCKESVEVDNKQRHTTKIQHTEKSTNIETSQSVEKQTKQHISEHVETKRVSIDISPTHDAFVRSLRSVTPERDRKSSYPRMTGPAKPFSERKSSQQYGSNETITKSIHTTHQFDVDSKSRSISPTEQNRSISPAKRASRRMSNESKPTINKEKVLRRTDTYEERVRQILGITEKKKSTTEKNISDIIQADKNAMRTSPSKDKSPEKKVQEYPAQRRRSSAQPEPGRKSPVKDIAPQSNWLPSAPRDTPQRVTATATAKNIRKYHEGRPSCSPSVDLKDVPTHNGLDHKSPSGGNDEILLKAFTTSKKGKTYDVDFVKVEKEQLRLEKQSAKKKSPERKSPERKFTQEIRKDDIDAVNITEKLFSKDHKAMTTDRESVEDELLRQNVDYIHGKNEKEPAMSSRKTPSSSKSFEDDIIVGEHEIVKKNRSVGVDREAKTLTNVKKTSLSDITSETQDQTRSVTTTINIPSETTLTQKKGPKEAPTESPTCISTKSIIINDAVAEQREIIVDLKRSKSSREDSPEKIWPVQMEEDSGIPRYPDQIQEPDERHAHKLKDIKDVIIDEEHDEESHRITEMVNTAITDVDRVAETDECLLTVTEKVNKFSKEPSTSQKSKGPAPKVSRPQFDNDQDLESDECLLSVSDKVNKFKTTADKLRERPKSPRCQFNKEDMESASSEIQKRTTEDNETILHVTDKVSKFVDSPIPAKMKPKEKNVYLETPKSSKKVDLSSITTASSSKANREMHKLAPMKDVKLEDIGVASTTRRTSDSEKKHLESVRRTLTFEEDSAVPGYMKQLDRTLRITSPHRASVMELEAISQGHVAQTDETKTISKFGVTLKKTHSLRGSTTRARHARDETTIEINDMMKEIEDVKDLQVLEAMLDTVNNYELRRRIRAQIRVVKNTINEDKVRQTNGRHKSPEKITSTNTYSKSTIKKVTSSDKKSPTRTADKIEFKPFRRSPDRQLDSGAKKDERPDWVKERNLRKASERNLSTNVASSSTKKTTHRISSVQEKHATDAITSCYGIGPTDDNGMPLFGLKALRAHNKVKGQVTKSVAYSADGQSPTGEITVITYSSNASDLGPGSVQSHKNGISSQTTTQKFGTRQNLSSNTKKVTDSKITKSNRRSSVKDITERFIVETAKSERDEAYRAGLILRNPGFKDHKSTTSRESTPEMITKSTSAKHQTSGSFLSNTSKVSGLQDVISRMRSNETVASDTPEDAEARQLLNKFLGSQVILSGMESSDSRHSQRMNGTQSTSATTTTTAQNKRTTKVTTTITENGVPTTSVRTFTHPITQEVLETIWCEQTLRLLLEQSTEYEERRIIRARLKQVMAEKEACDAFVEKTSEECQAGNVTKVHGESLLLPLLQNAIVPPEFEQTADSGTESGEDLRSGLILEVQNALNKLSACLCSDTSDISQERRNSLLQLVSKLQTNLNVPTCADDGNDVDAAANDNADGCSERRLRGGRFLRRPQRQRHTIGVSSEELEDARRLMEEFVLSSSQENVPAVEKTDDRPTYGPIKTNQGVKNAMPKPFASSTNTSGASSTAQTPSNESVDDLLSHAELDAIQTSEQRYCYKQSVSLDQQDESNVKPMVHSYSMDYTPNMELINAVQQAALLKISPEVHESYNTGERVLEKVDSSKHGLKESTFPQSPVISATIPNQLKDGDTVVLYDQSIYPPAMPSQTPTIPTSYEEPIIIQSNPIYVQDLDKSNRFNAKKSRMKRANTIDIPKTTNYYYDKHVSDSEPETNSRKSNYLALRGPIRFGNQAQPTKVPEFEPKTESDKKFLAFINRQNSSSVNNKITLWDKAAHNNTESQTAANNWSRKFGNIKTNFEKANSNSVHHGEPSKNSARNFWKCAESQSLGARNLRERFEIEPKANAVNKDVISGNYRADAMPKSIKSQPFPVNKFMHDPNESDFKPIQQSSKPDMIANVKMNVNESRAPNRALNSSVNCTGTGRVVNLAAKKFENSNSNANSNEDMRFVPRKLSKDRSYEPLLQNNKTEKLVAFVPPITKAGGVRKLSGQYDTMEANARGEHTAQTNVKYKSAFAPVPQTRNTQNSVMSSPQNINPPGLNQFAHHQRIHQDIPASFHNTHPKVQHIQMDMQQNLDGGHIYYNNVHAMNKYGQNVHNDYNSPEYHHNISEPMHVSQNSTKHSEYYPSHYAASQNHLEHHQYPREYQQTLATRNSQQSLCHEPQTFYNNVIYEAPKDCYAQKLERAIKPDIIRPQYNSQISNESVHECVAVNSKVMTGPVSQQAVTVTNKPKTRDDHDLDAALNLRSALQKKTQSPHPIPTPSYTPKFCVNDEPLSLDSLEANTSGESITTKKLQMSQMGQRESPQLSKSESWHQVVQKEQIARKPSPRASPHVQNVVKSKSTHALAVPKQFEAGMSKDEMLVKRRTMEAYFGMSLSPVKGQQESNHASSKCRTIHRVRTNQKMSATTTGLCRSRTLPDFACPDLLDETNVDAAFEDLFQSAT